MMTDAVVPVEWPVQKSWTVNQVIEAYPESIAVFNHAGVDTCCGGDETLETAAADASLDGHALLDALRISIQAAGRPE